MQYHKTNTYFNQFKMSGNRDWTPLLRSLLGNSVIRTMEAVSRNAFLRGPKTYWTYSNGKTSFAELGASDTFNLETVNAWNLRLGNTGSPVVPGRASNEKVVIVPPGAVYDFQESLAAASASEAKLWIDSRFYQGQALRYELGAYKNIAFIESPNDTYAQNPAVLYNAGTIQKQVTVTTQIRQGDGSPDPETTKVDETWSVGQKDRVHYIQCADFADGDFAVNDVVSIHTLRTNAYGVTNGVDFLSGKTITRRVVSVDHANNRLAFDRPIMLGYTTDLGGGVYAYVTKAQHIGFGLAVAGRGGVKGNLNKPLEFYDPKPIDDFNSVFRFTWDMIGGIGVWEPNVFEPHFFSVSLPKPGGIISPVAIS